jgi:hypothetical protein
MFSASTASPKYSNWVSWKMMKFFTSSGATSNTTRITNEVPKPSVMARFGTASTAGASVTTSSTALMIKLASRWAGQTAQPV